jgi:uncharacterized protein
MANLIQKTEEFVRSLTQNEATGHDWQHTQRVTAMALRLAKSESVPVNEELIHLACLLHDVKDYKLSGDEKAGPQAAHDWLSLNHADKQLTDQVVEIISTLSFKGKVDRPMSNREGMIVQDADRLDAVGAIGIARAFAFGGAHGREIVNPEISFRINLSPEDYKNKTLPTTSLNHFYEKLFRLDGHYHTALANEIGHLRHEFIKAFVKELLIECDCVETRFYNDLEKDEF